MLLAMQSAGARIVRPPSAAIASPARLSFFIDLNRAKIF